LEMARNYWDEMGRGQEKGMHGPMLAKLADYFAIDAESYEIVPESLALSNTMNALAFNRRYAFLSVGALGVIELTAPGRAARVVEGLKRVGAPAKARHYFALHAVLDVRHAEAWNAEVIAPLVAEDPRRAVLIAEGALLRLRCGEACFESYRRAFGAEAPLARAPAAVLTSVEQSASPSLQV
jgi:pyrroloquinoline quinone (PQQ) biosynthesis protein C